MFHFGNVLDEILRLRATHFAQNDNIVVRHFERNEVESKNPLSEGAEKSQSKHITADNVGAWTLQIEQNML